ncbi:S-DNA-T family DNA segregation ATPase FtsK/SpoIIIE [Actinomadura pelletieri DSM 43383]|uniref:S-DNA-T family DNA segregation ATPase FtsK/SpoIIIE n=1 Tax=Actinomadura pelletieri DSM 43383 TaxID=1120940 RepID=A0A495QZC1_9ACTN|nr:FtsK/SpoIIIE domain-containing protein [Actinomadura pelletieri]RKS79565.1 S-DNA-T family DNA segregation ATPase FtsK/SpoIIIE [Actinomadura pelletieri DSM 43383]
MAWEFRKLGPGENVAVEADRDPFAAPKWAPPVWHMPEGLVLIVNTVRALVRTVVFLVRNIVPVSVVAGLGWLGYRFGWAVPVLVLALVAVGLGVWAAVDRPSFVRWVAYPALAWWRLVTVYRRDWQPVLVTAGLTKVHKGREYLPSLVRVRCGPTSDRVLVRMLKGQAPDAWERVAANLAHGFGAALVRVRDGGRPGRICLEFVRRDALATPIPALPVLDPAEVDLSGLVVGRCEDGSPWRLRLLGTHVLIAGATGAGKGSVIWSTVRAVHPLILAGLVEVWAIDPKRMELSFGRVLFERYGRYSDDPKGGMVELLEAAAEDMNARAERFAGLTRSFTPSTEFPFRVIVVDELAFLTAYCPERDLRRRAESALAVLTSQGRSVGYCVIGAQQDARKEVNNLRNLFPDRIALRLDEDEQVDMVLGDGARDRGALADQISTVPALGAGVGFVRLEASPDPVRVRAAYVSDTDIRAMVAYGLPDLDAEGAA